MSKRQAIGGVTILLALAICGWIVFQSQRNGSAEHKVQPQSTSYPGTWQNRLVRQGIAEQGVSRARVEPLAGFYGTTEGMPMASRRRIAENLNGVTSLHLRFDQAQYVRTPAGVGLWLVEGKVVTCIFREKLPASSCNTRIDAARSGIYVETFEPGKTPAATPKHFVVLGIAPARVRSIRAKVGPRSIAIPTTENTYEYRANVPIRVFLPES